MVTQVASHYSKQWDTTCEHLQTLLLNELKLHSHTHTNLHVNLSYNIIYILLTYKNESPRECERSYAFWDTDSAEYYSNFLRWFTKQVKCISEFKQSISRSWLCSSREVVQVRSAWSLLALLVLVSHSPKTCMNMHKLRQNESKINLRWIQDKHKYCFWNLLTNRGSKIPLSEWIRLHRGSLNPWLRSHNRLFSALVVSPLGKCVYKVSK